MVICQKEADEIETEEEHGMSHLSRDLTLSTGQRGCGWAKKTNAPGNEVPQRMISQQKGSPFAYDAFEKLAKISSDKAEPKVLELITALCLL